MLNWFKKRPKKPIELVDNSRVNTSTNQHFIQNHSLTGNSKMFKNFSEKKNLEDTFSKPKSRESFDDIKKNVRILDDLENINENKGKG